MGTTFATVNACCALCGSPVLSIGRTGRVLQDDLHPIQIGRDSSRGYTLCDECGVLADLPVDLTLN